METKMKRTLIAFAAVALLLPFAGVRSDAQNTNAPPPGRPAGFRPGDAILPALIVDKLALTADQKDQYDKLNADYKKEHEAWVSAHQAQLDALQQQTQAARQAEDHEKMDELRQQRRELMKPANDLRKQYLDKVRGLLTDDQKKTLDSSLPQWRGGGPGGPGGPGGHGDHGPDGAPPKD
jgi:Spy/CpxP family protein refolding chaperone